MPVHDSLRQPRGARREQNPQRMVEVDGHRVQFIGVGLRRELRCQHGGPQRRQAGLQRGDVVAFVVGLAAVPIAVGGDQDDRLQLAEPVQRRLRGIVLPAGAPDGADTRRRQKRDHRLGDVGQVAHDTVARRHSVRTQRLRECRSASEQFVPWQLGHLPVLADMQDRGPVGAGVAHDLVDVVHAHTGEPPRTRHLRVVEHTIGRVPELEVLPQCAPECGRVVDRPLPQRLVVGHRRARALLHEPGEVGDACVRDIAFRRLPLGNGRRVGGLCHRALQPPSMVYDAPVTIPAAGEASQPTRAATSSGSTSRLIALSFSRISATT